MLTSGWSHYFDPTLYVIYHEKCCWSDKLSVSALKHIYQSAFLKPLEHKITAPVTWQSLIKFAIMCPTWVWTNIQPWLFTAAGGWCEIQMSCVSPGNVQTTWRTKPDLLWIFHLILHLSAQVIEIINTLRFNLGCVHFKHLLFSETFEHGSFFSQVNISIH